MTAKIKQNIIQEIAEADFQILSAISRRFALGIQQAQNSECALTQIEADRLVELIVVRMSTGATSIGLPPSIGRGPLTLLYRGLLEHELRIRNEKHAQ